MISERYSTEHRKQNKKEYEEKFKKSPKDAYYSLKLFLDIFDSGKRREKERIETERKDAKERETLKEIIAEGTAEGLKRYRRSQGLE